MKKNILILSLILAGSLCVILALVNVSGPGTPMIGQARRYTVIEAVTEDSIRLPASINMMQIADGCLYGFADKQKVLFRTNLENRKTDTLLYIPSLFSGVLNGITFDPATKTFYFLNARSRKIYLYHLPDARKDSFNTGTLRLSGGEKCFTGAAFFIRSVEYPTNLTTLKKADYTRNADTTLYTFPLYPDGGISSDGFFRKDASSKKQFYIPYYNAEIIAYDEADDKISKIITIDKTKPYNAAIPMEQGYGLSGKAKMINMAAATDSTHLYLLSYTSSPGKNEKAGTVVDIYSTLTGNYEGSLQFPYFENHPATLLEKYGDRLYVAFSNNIVSYKINYR